MAASNEYYLSEVNRRIVSELLGELEKQIRLAKVDTEKGESDGLRAIKRGKNKDGSLSFSHVNGDDCDVKREERLEAELEYLNLKEEFSNLQLNGNGSREANGVKKFSKSVDFILGVIKKTKKSVGETGSFEIFKKEVDKRLEELNREAQIQSDIEGVKNRIAKLRQDIVSLEEDSAAEIKLKMGEISRLKDECFFTEVEGDEIGKCAKMYFEANKTISKSDHNDQTSIEKKKTKEAATKIDRDVHCLAMMEAWTDEFCEKLEAEIDTWKLKLRKDEMLMDMRVDAKRRDIQAQLEMMDALNETIAQRMEELAPWEEEKEIERQERLTHMRRYYSARKLQRWWRGYMVKLKLYRKKKVKTKAGH